MDSSQGPCSPLKALSVKQHQEEIESLKKANFNLKMKLYHLEEKMGQMTTGQTDVEQVLLENAQLRVELQEMRAFAVKAEKYITNLAEKVQEKPDFQARMQLEQDNARLENDLWEMRQQLGSTQQTLRESNAKLERANEELASLQAKLTAAEQERDQALKDQKETVDSLILRMQQQREGESSSLQSKLEATEAERELLSGRVASLSAELDRRINEDSETKTKLMMLEEDARQKSFETTEMLTNAREAMEKLRDQLDVANRDKEILQKDLDRTLEDLSSARTELSACDAKRSQTTAELAEMQQRFDSLEIQKAQTDADMVKAAQVLYEKCEQSMSREEDLQRQLDSLTVRYGALEKDSISQIYELKKFVLYIEKNLDLFFTMPAGAQMSPFAASPSVVSGSRPSLLSPPHVAKLTSPVRSSPYVPLSALSTPPPFASMLMPPEPATPTLQLTFSSLRAGIESKLRMLLSVRREIETSVGKRFETMANQLIAAFEATCGVRLGNLTSQLDRLARVGAAMRQLQRDNVRLKSDAAMYEGHFQRLKRQHDLEVSERDSQLLSLAKENAALKADLVATRRMLENLEFDFRQYRDEAEPKIHAFRDELERRTKESNLNGERLKESNRLLILEIEERKQKLAAFQKENKLFRDELATAQRQLFEKETEIRRMKDKKQQELEEIRRTFESKIQAIKESNWSLST